MQSRNKLTHYDLRDRTKEITNKEIDYSNH